MHEPLGVPGSQISRQLGTITAFIESRSNAGPETTILILASISDQANRISPATPLTRTSSKFGDSLDSGARPGDFRAADGQV